MTSITGLGLVAAGALSARRRGRGRARAAGPDRGQLKDSATAKEGRKELPARKATLRSRSAPTTAAPVSISASAPGWGRDDCESTRAHSPTSSAWHRPYRLLDQDERAATYPDDQNRNRLRRHAGRRRRRAGVCGSLQGLRRDSASGRCRVMLISRGREAWKVPGGLRCEGRQGPPQAEQRSARSVRGLARRGGPGSPLHRRRSALRPKLPGRAGARRRPDIVTGRGDLRRRREATRHAHGDRAVRLASPGGRWGLRGEERSPSRA